MHELGRSGQVTGTPEQLARLGRCTVKELTSAVDELGTSHAALVSERGGKITIQNRRMIREKQARAKDRIRKQHQRVRERSRASPGDISYSSSLSGGREPLRASPPPSGDAPPGGGHKSRFSLEQCLAFARSAKGIDSPDAFAKTIWRSGEDDKRIAAFLEPPAQIAEITKPVNIADLQRLADELERMEHHEDEVRALRKIIDQ